MPDEPNNNGAERPQRFRLSRKVTAEPVRTREEVEMKALEELDDADRGTPEQDASLRQGCTGCLRVTGLFFIIMLTSIVATWFIRR
jgi:hypothetical protein